VVVDVVLVVDVVCGLACSAPLPPQPVTATRNARTNARTAHIATAVADVRRGGFVSPHSQQVAKGSRFPGGLFVVAVELHADCLAFRIFASRKTRATAIQQRFTVSDSTGTAYVMQAGEDEVVDGKATLTFTPGLAREAT
jgi:hypothetical protein